ncbi:putative autotransporter precursor [compost metagenome]
MLGEGKVVQPYLRAAYVHEFASNNEVKVNNNAFNNDLSGSRGELGAGVSLTLTDKVSLHAEFDYSHGDKIEQPWGANVGARYRW